MIGPAKLMPPGVRNVGEGAGAWAAPRWHEGELLMERSAALAWMARMCGSTWYSKGRGGTNNDCRPTAGSGSPTLPGSNGATRSPRGSFNTERFCRSPFSGLGLKNSLAANPTPIQRVTGHRWSRMPHGAPCTAINDAAQTVLRLSPATPNAAEEAYCSWPQPPLQ